MDFSFNSQIANITHCADEAVFVHRIRYLTLNNEANGRNFRDGKYWTYDSAQALLKIFDFWSLKQLRRIIKNCVELGLIETGNFSESALDHRTWYTLTDKARELYEAGRTDLPKGTDQDTKRANGDAQRGKWTCPKGQIIYKEAIKDTIKDLKENARGTRAAPARDIYGEFKNVQLSEEEYARLCERWGKSEVLQQIEELSSYMASRGKRYKSHCATLSNWLRRKQQEKRQEEKQHVYSQGPELEEW